MKTYTSVESFKEGDLVWLTYLEVTKSGRIKTNLPPHHVKIVSVDNSNNQINVGITWFGVPCVYGIGIGYWENDLNNYISESHEEAVEKYNKLLDQVIEDKFNSFKILEKRLLSNKIY